MYGLQKSEYAALKKANKNPRDFKKAIVEKKIEQLKQQGVVDETTTIRKTAKKPH